MFDKLRNKIIITTMTITTGVLLLAGGSVMLFVTTWRPEPKPIIEHEMREIVMMDQGYTEEHIRGFIENDRKDGDARLLRSLLSVGATIEISVFLIVYVLSKQIVAPVEDAYKKQKLFIANASHELKTPLAVIQANMEAMEVDAENQEWKNNIENEISRTNTLVLNLLKLARMDANDSSKNPAEPVNMLATINGRVKIFKPKFAGAITVKNEAKDAKFLLPKQDIVQLLDILLDNATKYGEKTIAITLEPHRVTIANDGAKVAKDDLAKIFDRFYQTDKTKEGSGLGLAIAKMICEQNEWRIHCESDNESTMFVVDLKHKH